MIAVDDKAVPVVLFCYYQCGAVGQTETALKRDGIAHRGNPGTGIISQGGLIAD
ncbi:MAG: hypothetical protein KKH68_03935 [Proteobacteria bacterium]|nr:hypothetical protein [Pseudomonadota bacterium]